MKKEKQYVQLMERTAQGITLIGQPVERSFGLKIREELFRNSPSIIPYPSMPPKKMNKKLRKVI